MPIPSRAWRIERELPLVRDVEEPAEQQGVILLDSKHLELIVTFRRRRDLVADPQLLQIQANLARTRDAGVIEQVDTVEAAALATHLHQPRPDLFRRR